MSQNNSLMPMRYYPSKYSPHLRTASSALKIQNQILLVARKVFFAITELKMGKSIQDTHYLRAYLIQELNDFQSELKKVQHVDTDTVLISRYILCTVLDEIIQDLVAKKKATWEFPTFIEEFYAEGYADENFFIILDRVSQAPHQYVDLLELMYVCLSLGYEGKFRNQPLSQRELQQLINFTYQLIREQRGEVDKRLSPSVSVQAIKQDVGMPGQQKRYSIVRVIFIALGIILLLDILFNYLLQLCSHSLLQELQQATEMLVQ